MEVVRQPGASFAGYSLHAGVGLKRVWSDGTSTLVFSPSELVERLVALVPPPRANQVIYRGVVAANAAWRAEVVPSPPPEPPDAAKARRAKRLTRHPPRDRAAGGEGQVRGGGDAGFIFPIRPVSALRVTPPRA